MRNMTPKNVTRNGCKSNGCEDGLIEMEEPMNEPHTPVFKVESKARGSGGQLHLDAPTTSSIAISNKVPCWNFLGKRVRKPDFVYFAQIFLIYVVVITALTNLTLGRQEIKNSKLWIFLLSSCVGYVLPNPSIRSVCNHSY
jgi:hypothetical protein